MEVSCTPASMFCDRPCCIDLLRVDDFVYVIILKVKFFNNHDDVILLMLGTTCLLYFLCACVPQTKKLMNIISSA
jgi:hypothetical protein